MIFTDSDARVYNCTLSYQLVHKIQYSGVWSSHALRVKPVATCRLSRFRVTRGGFIHFIAPGRCHTFHTFQAISSHFKPFHTVSLALPPPPAAVRRGRARRPQLAGAPPRLTPHPTQAPWDPRHADNCSEVYRARLLQAPGIRDMLTIAQKSSSLSNVGSGTSSSDSALVCLARPSLSFGRNLSACSMQLFCAGWSMKRGF